LNNINLITCERAGWITAYNMFYVIFEHGMIYVWFGCAGNVFTTCNGRGQDKRSRAYARSRVYMSDKEGGTLGEYYGT